MMTLILLSALVFIATAGLLYSGLYFLIGLPAEKRALQARMETLQEISLGSSDDMETGIVRQELLASVDGFQRILLRYRSAAKLSVFLRQSGSETPVGIFLTYALCAALLAALLCWLFEVPLLVLPLVSLAAGSIPFMVVSIRRQRRFSKFQEAFPDAIDLLARAVRAGHAFTTGLELIAQDMPEPVAGEFRTAYEQQNLGLPIRQALENMVLRMPSPDVKVFVTGLIVQREAGGNLAEMLDNLSQVIRERFKLYRQIQAFTAQGRLTHLFLTFLPPITALAIFSMNPSYVGELFRDPLGQKFVATAVILQIVGFFVIRSIIRPKI